MILIICRYLPFRDRESLGRIRYRLRCGDPPGHGKGGGDRRRRRRLLLATATVASSEISRRYRRRLCTCFSSFYCYCRIRVFLIKSTEPRRKQKNGTGEREREACSETRYWLSSPCLARAERLISLSFRWKKIFEFLRRKF